MGTADESLRKTALVTGASGGIGRALALECVRRGLRVVAVGRNSEELASLSSSTGGPQGSIIAVSHDLLAPGSTATLVDFLQRRDIRVDLLINCAGRGLLAPFDAVAADAQRDVLRLNFEVPIELTHALLPALKTRRGAVLNIASLVAFLPAPGLSMLAASKAALISWSVALRRELLGTVSVTAFCPGVTRTAFLQRGGMEHLQLERSFIATSPAVVAAKALDAVGTNKAVAFSTPIDRVAALLCKLLPGWASAAAVAHLLGQFKRASSGST